MYSLIFRRSYRCFRGFFGWLSTLRNGCLGLRMASVMTSNDLVIAGVPLFSFVRREGCQRAFGLKPTIVPDLLDDWHRLLQAILLYDMAPDCLFKKFSLL